ncbi:MAG: glycosyltransferase family 8 protein, partial [Chroococcidiopsidaceae cyanobacterium CP_BM_RX_35]|nr:glycosyltransferase family 8 protein [Chroococcidiopsidaceae cyanobacterium CP_BM_RX_35]
MSTVDNNSIIVVCAADNNYAMPLAVMARSILANLKSPRKVTLFILDNGIKEHNKRRIIKSLNSEQCDIRWISMANVMLDNLPMCEYASTYMSPTTYCRVFIPELLPDNLNKAIYLDSDLIVNEDLGQLWDINIGENYLLAVQDNLIRYISSHIGTEKCKEL